MMEREIAVSVIMLAYNQEAYIAQAIESVLAQQTGFRYELLIGDDASPDGTGEIAEDYACRYPDRIRVFRRPENLGASRNAYELLCQAQGRYLAFCEGDDYWTAPDKLAVQYAFLEEHPDLIGCTHRCVVVDEHGDPLPKQRISWVREKPRFTLRDFQGIYLPGQTATIMKRNIFLDKNGDLSFLYEANRNVSDRTATLLYLTKGDFGLIPRVMSAYRRVRRGPQSQTDQLYTHNPDVARMELAYTERLEETAARLTSERGLFKPYYQRLYAAAVYRYLRSPSKGGRETVALIGRHLGGGGVHPAAFVAGVARRIADAL